MRGFAVVDTETTGFYAEGSDRIVEFAVVTLTPAGEFEQSWCTLLNPQRDLGPTFVHGIAARDVLDAPTFRQAASTIAAFLADRVFVAHNVAFDRRFVESEFARAGIPLQLHADSQLCTQRLSAAAFPGGPRKLTDCCQRAGIELSEAHQALADATAVAQLLRVFVTTNRVDTRSLRGVSIPQIMAHQQIRPVVRGVSGDASLLAELPVDAERSPSVAEQHHYLTLISQAVADHVISAREKTRLIGYARDVGITRPIAESLHQTFLVSLRNAIPDIGSPITVDSPDIATVGSLLEICPADIQRVAALSRENTHIYTKRVFETNAFVPPFRFEEGDIVVFTGEASVPRHRLEDIAIDAGLRLGSYVTKSTRAVLAADPDSLSSKARKADQYGIPVLGVSAFDSLLPQRP